MTFLLLAIALGLLALPLVIRPLPSEGRLHASGFNGNGVLIGFAVTLAVAYLTSPLFGFGFVFTVLFHEVSSAYACRIIGHDSARIRLVPLPIIAPPRSDRAFSHAIEESFAALYAPALAIVPMVLAFALFHVLAPVAPALANMMRVSAIMLGTFNFIILLPFMPFAGGRVIRAISDAFWPRLGTGISLFMTAAFASAALRDHSIAMGLLAAAGVQSLLYKRPADQKPLTHNEALLVMACYAFVLTVHYLGGSLLLNIWL